MECKVIKRFQDKNTKIIYQIGSIFSSEDEERVDFLQESGFLEKEESAEPGEKNVHQDVDLSGNVDEVNEQITVELGKETLESLLTSEKEGQNRKGVTKHIESLLKVDDK